MKIVKLEAENVKKLRAVEITPEGNLVEITGRNGQGKTSILDSIWWALAGASNIQSAPIRRGEKQARIRLDLGDIIVTRTFKTKGEAEPFTTSITVENADGARFPSPQAMLDGLLGALAFDPLEFARMKPREQFDALRRFVPGVDFDAIEKQNRADYDRRTELNRQAKAARAAADAIAVSLDGPLDGPDEAALVAELERAGQLNAGIATRKERRAAAAEKIRESLDRATAVEESIGERVAQLEKEGREEIARIDAKIAELQKEREDLVRETGKEIKDLADGLREDVARIRASAADLQAKLDAAPALEEPVDTAALRKKVEDARALNAEIAQRRAKRSKLDAAEQLEIAAEALTKSIAEREQQKQAAIAAAQLPIPGIAFGAGELLLDGVPFDQASDAERLRASVAIAAASSPKLRVIRVRDGSLLDPDGMRLLGEMADANDMQIWVETVASGSKLAVELRDGQVVKADEREEARA